MKTKLIELLRERGAKGELGYGITTADRYVRTVTDCVGPDVCQRLYGEAIKSAAELIKAAADKLVYSSPDMVAEVKQSSGDFRELLSDETEVPKNTLMVVRHVLTTPRKDRDGDTLRTQGAQVDPKMLLLWQHIHTLPIGKLLEVVEHTSKVLRNVTAIVDINELAHDAAVMIDNGMGRFSHGFRAMDWEQIKDGGFDVKVFEIMEQSLVSVPSNVDAEVEDVLMGLHDRRSVKSDVVRGWIEKHVKDKRDVTVAGAQMTLRFAGAEIELKGGQSGPKVREQKAPEPCKCEPPEEKTAELETVAFDDQTEQPGEPKAATQPEPTPVEEPLAAPTIKDALEILARLDLDEIHKHREALGAFLQMAEREQQLKAYTELVAS